MYPNMGPAYYNIGSKNVSFLTSGDMVSYKQQNGVTKRAWFDAQNNNF